MRYARTCKPKQRPTTTQWPADWTTRSCAPAHRNLTPAEFHDRQYPDTLTDEPGTGQVRLPTELGGRGQVPRDDVAAILAEVLQAPNTIGIIAELFTGNTPTAQAVLSLQHPAPAGDAQHHRERAAR